MSCENKRKSSTTKKNELYCNTLRRDNSTPVTGRFARAVRYWTRDLSVSRYGTVTLAVGSLFSDMGEWHSR